jgi:hypothetical protein
VTFIDKNYNILLDFLISLKKDALISQKDASVQKLSGSMQPRDGDFFLAEGKTPWAVYQNLEHSKS